MPDNRINDELAQWSPGFAQGGRHAAAEPRATNAQGIDTASYQGAPDWRQVAASGKSFCYVKASQGSNSTYATLDPQYQGAKAAGLLVGLYHFAEPDLSPEANADAFAAQINRLGAVSGHLPPCLDLETGSGDLSGWAQRFITRLRANTGCVRVMVYSSASFFANQIREDWMDQNIALWIAHFGAQPGKPAYLTPRVAIHQYSSSGSVAGINGSVDLDWAIWDLSALVPGVSGGSPTVSARDLSTVQDAALTGIYQQLSGSPKPGEWTGWASWPGGSGRTLTMLDFIRQADVQLCALKAQIAALKPATNTQASLSDADVNRIATAVMAMLAQRMQS